MGSPVLLSNPLEITVLDGANEGMQHICDAFNGFLSSTGT